MANSQLRPVRPYAPRRMRPRPALGQFNGHDVVKVLDDGRLLIWGWPTPISPKVRTELPPIPGKATYGPAARTEARRLMAEAKRTKRAFGWFTMMNLCRVAKGEAPLRWSVWTGAIRYLTEKARQADLEQRPMALDLAGLSFGAGVGLGWRR
jgi:hypothetical protein